jgi:hypothetical protein
VKSEGGNATASVASVQFPWTHVTNGDVDTGDDDDVDDVDDDGDDDGGDDDDDVDDGDFDEKASRVHPPAE